MILVIPYLEVNPVWRDSSSFGIQGIIVLNSFGWLSPEFAYNLNDDKSPFHRTFVNKLMTMVAKTLVADQLEDGGTITRHIFSADFMHKISSASTADVSTRYSTPLWNGVQNAA
ncbi:hypothetical protein K1719_019284 [Acacia pycnantha]|nr:hypothetical protein K1719_019284 [Acacia pycnantha]